MRTRLCMRKLTDDPGNLLAPVFSAYRQTLIEGRYVPDIQGRYFAAVFHFGDWLRSSGIGIRVVRHEHICDFLQSHLPTCTSKLSAIHTAIQNITGLRCSCLSG